MHERAENLHPAPSTIDVLGLFPSNRSHFAETLAKTLSADLVIDRVSGNPFRRRYLEDPIKWSVKYHTRAIAEKMGAFQKLTKKGESRRIIIFPSFEMNRLSVEVERKLGLINERDYELFMDLFGTFKKIGAIRIPDMTLYLSTKPANVFEKCLTDSIREVIEKRDERFIMFLDLDMQDSCKEGLRHMRKWVNYRFDDTN